MSKADLTSCGLPGVFYVYGGKVKSIVTASGSKFRLKHNPWDLPDSDREELAEFLEVPLGDLEDAIVRLHDTMKSLGSKAQMGTPKHVEATWDDVVEFNAKGEPKGLKYAVIGNLMAKDFVRIDDLLMQSVNNIAKPVSKDYLTRVVLSKLKAQGAEDFWSTNSYTLIRDHILNNCPAKTIGQTAGFLPVKNGVIDLRKMELIQSEHVYLSCANVEYDPDATCPNTEKLLNNAFNPEQKELVLSILGAAISGRRAPFILFLSGRGRNGKSIVREMVTCLAADMITTEKLEKLHDRFSNQVFLGKRLIWETEVSSKRNFTDKLKDVTGGTSITIEYKNQNGQIQSELQSVVIIDTNSPPHLEDSQAIADRLRFVDMPRVFVYELTGKANEVLIDANLAEAWRDEMPGLLNLILPYAQYFLEKGHLKHDYKVGMEKYNEKADALSIFISEWCDTSDDIEITQSTFCKYYRMFATKQNVSAMNDGQIRHQLKYEYGFKVVGVKIRGIRPKTQLILDAFG